MRRFVRCCQSAKGRMPGKRWNMAITYNNLYLDVRRALRLAGVEAAQLEARELLCRVTHKSREQFWLDLNYYASSEQERQVRDLLQRRLEGTPVAYLLGEWSFCGLDLDVDPTVLIPRADTEVLAELAAERTRAAGERARMLDLCAGTGCVGLAVATMAPNCRAVLADYSPDAVRVCRQNIRRCGLLPSVTCFQVDAREDPPQQLWNFDVIASNPPYIPTEEIQTLDHSVRDYEPHLALDGGEDGLDFYRSITEKWRNCLPAGGRLYFEVGIGQADQVLRIMRSQGFGDIQIVKDHHDIPRVVFGTLCTEI